MLYQRINSEKGQDTWPVQINFWRARFPNNSVFLRHVSYPGAQRLAQFSSKLSRRIWRPIPRYASDFQTVKCARKPKSSSRSWWIDICSRLASFNVITNGDVEMNTNISVHSPWEFHDATCAAADVGIRYFDSVVCRRRTSGGTNILLLSIYYN